MKVWPLTELELIVEKPQIVNLPEHIHVVSHEVQSIIFLDRLHRLILLIVLWLK